MTAFGDQAKMLRRNVWGYFEGLTDDDLHWEPASGMWGMRLKTEVSTDRTPDELPPGDYWVDVIRDPPDPVPLTTIAWRIGHLTLGTWNWNAIIAGQEVPPEPAMRHDAAGALELWREVLDAFVDVAVGFTDEQLADKTDAWGGEVTRSFLVSHVCLEIALHSAEVGTMRHLKRQLGTGAP